VHQNAKENGHITPLNGGLGAWNGAGGRHRAPLDAARLEAVGRMAGNLYTRTSDLFTMDHDTFDVMATPAAAAAGQR
jgi:hypothetical protein